jgi:hypothetical protein
MTTYGEFFENPTGTLFAVLAIDELRLAPGEALVHGR